MGEVGGQDGKRFKTGHILDNAEWGKPAALGVGGGEEVSVDLTHTALDDEAEEEAEKHEAGF